MPSYRHHLHHDEDEYDCDDVNSIDWSWVWFIIKLICCLAIFAFSLATLIIVAIHINPWKGKTGDHDPPFVGDNGKGGKGGGKGGGNQDDDDPQLCNDPRDHWPAAEFPMRETDTLVATFCTDCLSTSKPIEKNDVYRSDFKHAESFSPTVGFDNNDDTRIYVTTLGYYRFQIVLTARSPCPVRKVEVALWDETQNVQLGDSVLVNGFAPTELFLNQIVKANTELSLHIIDPLASDRVAAYGRILRSSFLDRLLSDTLFDAQTEIKWIPFRPSNLPPPGASPLFPDQFPNSTIQYNWLLNRIPADIVQSPLPTMPSPLPPIQALPDNDGYAKFRGIPTSLNIYFARNTFTQSGDELTIDIFDMSLQDRGLDRNGRRNFRKMVYMSALTSEVSLNYVPKIESFVNRVYSEVVTNNQPLLSTFKKDLLDFFLDIHWGEDDERPEYVKDYFRLFLDIVGFGDPNLPGRNEAFMFGADNVDAVREYAKDQTIKVIANRDKTSIVYWWNIAGMPVEAQVTEAVHNVVAFSQFSHQLFLLVRDKLSGTPFPLPPPANLIQYNFLDVYASLPTDELKMNLIRESYRLLLPNGNDFSDVIEANPSGKTVKARHLRLPIQIGAYTLLAGGNQQAGTADFLNLNLNQYNDSVFGDDYNTNFTDLNCPNLRPEDSTLFYAEDQWDISPLDGETLIDKCNPKMFPVFKLLKYFPFGAGYRRCAGEAFNMIVTKLIMDRFATTEFEYRNTPGIEMVTLAPFVAQPDNIFFKKSTVDAFPL